MPEHKDHIRIKTAVILAAGMGTRLFNGGQTPKSLLPLVGMPIMARVMATAFRAGIRRFVVVIGYQAKMMRAGIPRLLPDGCELSLVENPRFKESNGISLMAALKTVDEPFALLMSDHLFSHDRLSQALAQNARTGRCLLVVEDKNNFDGDIGDATRVCVSDGRVVQIGKGLAHYDAIDTGMFILHPEPVVSALKKCGPSPSISDGMRRLASAGDLDALFLTTGFWQDIDTPEDLKTAEKKLYGSLTRATDGLLARLINRRVSLFFSSRIWRLGITPNRVTGFSLVLGILAGLAFSQGSGIGWGLLGATLFQLQSIIDGVDGELARLMHKEAPFGFWFDISVDNISHMAVFGGIAVGQTVDGVPGPWGFLGLFSILGVAASFAAMAPLLKPKTDKRALHDDDSRLKRLVDTLSRRDFTYLLFPLAVLGWLGGFLWAVAVGTWVFALTVVILRFRARRAFAPATGGRQP
jgi:1L-myo-inositol 1-phosphate cytidylyltransferase / CDP-L-myo-inositol myo-inositolphosphotransferase